MILRVCLIRLSLTHLVEKMFSSAFIHVLARLLNLFLRYLDFTKLFNKLLIFYFFIEITLSYASFCLLSFVKLLKHMKTFRQFSFIDGFVLTGSWCKHYLSKNRSRRWIYLNKVWRVLHGSMQLKTTYTS